MIDEVLKLAKEEKAEKKISDFIDEHAIACCVTRAEHKRLGKDPSAGWKRYNEAADGRILVWDRIQNTFRTMS